MTPVRRLRVESTPLATSRRMLMLACGLIILGALAAYHNSFSLPFVFDDLPGIVNNPTIRDLKAVDQVLSASTDTGTSARARPVVNLSLALNYAVGGLNVRGYHLFNLTVHLLAGLALFGIARRTLTYPPCRSLLGGERSASGGRDRRTPPQSAELAASDEAALQSNATLLALAIALVWTVHPLQTETVISAVQRTESLMGLFYLLTLYCFIRGTESGRLSGRSRFAGDQSRASGEQAPTSANGETAPGWRWFGLSMLACLLGMATKEVMVSAPLMVLLYDRTFAAGSFRSAWQQRRAYYLGLACTWILLGILVMTSGGQRGGTVGFGLGVSAWDYLLTQCRAIVLYLRLSLWPHPLIGDYGTSVAHSLAEVWWQAVVVLIVLGTTLWALVRRPLGGFLGAWFFSILAPSSSILPLTSQTIAEHRLYLPLAAVVSLLVVGGNRLARRRGAIAFLALAAGLGWLTVQRNDVYQTELSFWSDVVSKQPDNPRAHYNRGILLDHAGRQVEAIASYETALRLKPDDGDVHNNLGSLLYRLGRLPEAIAHYQRAIEIKPDFAEAHNNLGLALFNSGHLTESILQFEQALQLQPDHVGARTNLGIALIRAGRVDEAIIQFEQALTVAPGDADAHFSLASALDLSGRLPEALLHFQAALRLRPNFAAAYNAFGIALAKEGRLPEAIVQFEQGLKLHPEESGMRMNLGIALMKIGRTEDAVHQLERVVQAIPVDATAQFNLGNALVRAGRLSEAGTCYRSALKINPDFVEARQNLARLQALQDGPPQ